MPSLPVVLLTPTRCFYLIYTMRKAEHPPKKPLGLAKLLGGAFDCWILDLSGCLLEAHQSGPRPETVEVHNGKLKMLDPRAQLVLEQIIMRGTAGASEQWGCVVGPDGTMGGFIKFILFNHAQKQAFGGASIATIAFNWRRRDPASEILQLCFGFTPAEADVAAGLVRGKSLKDISCERGASVGTARSQLKHILAKMHVNRQSDVIAILDRLASFVGKEVRIAPEGRL
jgi:DNA-binding CsgD family transcriptional regulator